MRAVDLVPHHLHEHFVRRGSVKVWKVEKITEAKTLFNAQVVHNFVAQAYKLTYVSYCCRLLLQGR